MFKIITKKEYNELISQCKESVKVNDILIQKNELISHSKEIIRINDKLIQRIENLNDICNKLIK